MDAWMPDIGEAGGTAAGGTTSPRSIEPFTRAKERCVEEFERLYLERLVAEANGNLSQAARLADMDRKYLRELLKRYDLWTPGKPGFRRKRSLEAPVEAGAP